MALGFLVLALLAGAALPVQAGRARPLRRALQGADAEPRPDRRDRVARRRRRVGALLLTSLGGRGDSGDRLVGKPVEGLDRELEVLLLGVLELRVREPAQA